MGICCTKQIEYLEFPFFKQNIHLKAHQIDRSGKYTAHSELSINLTKPTDQSFRLISLPKIKFRASGCVIPGLDPHGEYKKDCQDSFAFLTCETSFLTILFDGHGRDGRRVSLFCRDFMLKYFEKSFKDFENNPKSAIEDMIKTCDDQLASSGIESSLSGTTALVIVVNTLGIHAGSVGDSRAILASLPRDLTSQKSTQKSTGSSRISKDLDITCPSTYKNIYKRPVNPSRQLCAVSLTIDQKPNNEEELKRIHSAGGVVEKIINDMGRPVGPYRVWSKKVHLPGLAMSRSIGDRFAHEIGVVSTPMINSYTYYPNIDKFIVIASDGIWDVMDNTEVVNFIEKFRYSAQNKGNSYPARTSNSSIARLVCEEARYRWMGIVEEQDVMIDDISCVVLEFNGLENFSQEKLLAESNKGNKFKSISVESAWKGERADTAKNDPVRRSAAGEKRNLDTTL